MGQRIKKSLEEHVSFTAFQLFIAYSACVFKKYKSILKNDLRALHFAAERKGNSKIHEKRSSYDKRKNGINNRVMNILVAFRFYGSKEYLHYASSVWYISDKLCLIVFPKKLIEVQ